MLELSSPFGSVNESVVVLVCGLALALIVAVLATLGLFARLGSTGGRLWGFQNVSLAALTTLQVIAWKTYLTHSPASVEFWFVGAALMIGLAVAALALLRPLAPQGRSGFALRSLVAVLALAELGGLAKVTELVANYEPPVELVGVPGSLNAAEEIVAVTDLGTRIPMYVRQASADDFERFIDSNRKTVQPVAQKAMLRGAPSPLTNCCGWVFTAGRYIVRCEDVGTILRENAYREAAVPQIGDVAVYRNDSGQIQHVGIVRGFMGSESPALVESKWGADGIYLHLADEQPYSCNISFWRSSRPTHVLHIQPRSDSQAAADSSAAETSSEPLNERSNGPAAERASEGPAGERAGQPAASVLRA
jgi:hypothetical protein